MRGTINTITEIQQFIFASNATFTIENEKSGNRFTYKVVRKNKKDKAGYIWFVNLLNGPDNVIDYQSLCFMFGNENGFCIRQNKQRIKPTATSYIAFDWLIKQINEKKELIAGVNFYHEGKCCRCGRKLTVPESIKSGIGPECKTLINK